MVFKYLLLMFVLCASMVVEVINVAKATKGKRITMTITGKQLEILRRIAEAVGRDPGDVARDIVNQTVDGISEIFDGAADSEFAVRKLYRMAFSKLQQSFEELEETSK